MRAEGEATSRNPRWTAELPSQLQRIEFEKQFGFLQILQLIVVIGSLTSPRRNRRRAHEHW